MIFRRRHRRFCSGLMLSLMLCTQAAFASAMCWHGELLTQPAMVDVAMPDVAMPDDEIADLGLSAMGSHKGDQLSWHAALVNGEG